jgi:ferritin-like protein
MCRSPTFDLEVEGAVAGDLVEHVVEETDAGVELALARTVQVDLDPDLGLEGVAEISACRIAGFSGETVETR